MSFPRATVRLQLHEHFTFQDAAATIDYYQSLGISHFYLSPIFTAREGSTHGYDVVDPTRISPALGGEAGFRHLVSQLREAGMGVVIDIVPNHMGVASSANRYWQDVLAWGAQSVYAHWFDIDWHHPDPRLTGKLLLPVLGEPYEAALASGVLGLTYDETSGAFALTCYDGQLPLSVRSYATILQGEAMFDGLATQFATASPADADALKAHLASLANSQEGKAALARLLARYACDCAGSSDLGESGQALHALLGEQHYRLTCWRNAAEDINWRRFFEVSDLAGLCVEKDDVFETTHALVFDLYKLGLIDGLRIDHVDGLAAPGAYCRKVRERLSSLQTQRPEGLREQPAWIVVEKILTPGETLSRQWGVDGTTGYDFMDQVGSVLHDPDGERALQQLWTRLTGDHQQFESQVQTAREQLLSENFVGELDALARLLQHHAASLGVAGRDIAPSALRRVLTALLAAFRRYRCYGVSDHADDQPVLQAAVNAALPQLHSHDHALLHEIAGWLGMAHTDAPGQPQAQGDTTLLERAITRFRQLTPPLAAKSVEDTVFYRFAPVLSRNDVGSYPANVSGGVSAIHAANLERASTFPHAMLATATHDHKRGEDSRARMAVLTEIPQRWAGLVDSWMASHQPLQATVPLAGGGLLASPTPADALILYQAIFGAWPDGLQPDDASAMAHFASRMAEWQQKALREAKTLSSWMWPHDAYEAACRAYLHGLLQAESGRAFRSQMAGLVADLSQAATANSLSQTLLRLASPGIPDLYQGADLADFSLVDPDNRTPVDMALRRACQAGSVTSPAALAGKQALIRHALALRQKHPAVFDGGDYLALKVEGRWADHVVAFERRAGNVRVLAVAMRKPWGVLRGAGLAERNLAEPVTVWGDTSIVLPADETQSRSGVWKNGLQDRGVTAKDGKLSVGGVMGQSAAVILIHTPS